VGVGAKAKNYSAVTAHFLQQLTSLSTMVSLEVLKGLTVNPRGKGTLESHLEPGEKKNSQ